MPRAQELLSQLLLQTFDVLNALPKRESIELAGYSKPVTLTTYRDKDPTGRVKVVVQLFVRGWLGSAGVWADGFTLAKEGGPVMLKPNELYDYY